MKLIHILLLTLFLTGQGCVTSTKLKDRKIKNLQSQVEVVKHIASAQSNALILTNIDLPIIKEYNLNILDVVQGPVVTTQTNFSKEVEQVKQESYKLTLDIAIELNKKDAEIQELNSTIKETKRWWGLKGVYIGLHQFIRNCMYSILAMTAILVVLRIFSATPVIGAAWTGICWIIGWMVNLIALIFPKALEFVKNTTGEITAVFKK